MDAITSGLAQMGGMGLLAAAILLLHRDALKMFREELAAERRACQQDHQLIMETIKDLKIEVAAQLASKRSTPNTRPST